MLQANRDRRRLTDGGETRDRSEEKILKIFIPNGTGRLQQRPATRPAQVDEVASEPVEQDGGRLVTARRAARRIGYVIGWAGCPAGRRGRRPSAGAGQPVAKRLAGGAGAGLQAPAEQARGS